jgi:hypothetical protein
MLYLLSFEWYGNPDQLKEWDASFKKTCEEMKGIKYMGRWAPMQSQYHFTYMFDTDDYNKPNIVLTKARPGYTRDYNKVPHSKVEVYQGPYDK